MPPTSLSRLAQALLNGPHQRMMLSSKELAELHILDQMNIPIEQMLKWIAEAFKQKEKKKIGSLLGVINGVKSKADRWQKHHVGEQFNQESFVQKEHVQKAFAVLIQSIHLNASEHHQTQTLALFQWLEIRLKNCLDTYLRNPSLNPIHLLKELNERVRIRALTTLDRSLLDRVHSQVKEQLKNESNRCRPQDLILTQRALEWRILREELRLPPLYLNLYGQW